MKGRDKRKWDKKGRRQANHPAKGEEVQILISSGISISFAAGFFVLALVLAAVDKQEHRRLWLTAAGCMVPFCLWITAASWPLLTLKAQAFLVVAPAMTVILAVVDRKYRVFWITSVGITLLGVAAYVYSFFWILKAYGTL
jgi:hypothetical protein